MNEERIARFWSKVEKTEGCWFWRGLVGKYSGYGVAPWKSQPRAHRVSWELHFGAIPAGLLVCHKCDVRNCVRPDHLFLGTVKDNGRDMAAKGRGNRNRKLTEGQVSEVRARLAVGETNRSIAARFGVDPSTISHIKTGWCYIVSRNPGPSY